MPVHPFPVDRLEGLIAVDDGLSPDAAAERLLRFGPNDIIEAPPAGATCWRKAHPIPCFGS